MHRLDNRYYIFARLINNMLSAPSSLYSVLNEGHFWPTCAYAWWAHMLRFLSVCTVSGKRITLPHKMRYFLIKGHPHPRWMTVLFDINGFSGSITVRVDIKSSEKNSILNSFKIRGREGVRPGCEV